MPFGLCIFPFIFDLFAKGIHWLLINGGWKNTFYYLDNFFPILSSNTEAQAYIDFFLHPCCVLRVHIKDEKSLRATITEFLGIELDSIKMEAKLSPAKLKNAEDWVKKIFAQQTITQENLQSPFKFLFFAAKVVHREILYRPNPNGGSEILSIYRDLPVAALDLLLSALDPPSSIFSDFSPALIFD